jgi:Fe-S oxidoreductase
MAKLKYEFTHHYYQEHKRHLRDYVFAYIATASAGILCASGDPFSPPYWIPPFTMRLMKIAPQRSLPIFARRSLRSLARDDGLSNSAPSVFLLSDPFTEYFHPQNGLAAIQALQAAGMQPKILPVVGAGRTLISKGFLDAARKHARRLVDAIAMLDPQGRIPVVGNEPSNLHFER